MLLEVLSLLVVALACSGELEKDCPVWTMRNTTGQCECGNSLDGALKCDPKTLQVSLLRCYCMTHSAEPNSTTLVVGACALMCAMTDAPRCRLLNTLPSTINETELDDTICGPMNRRGQLCGRCIEGHGYPVYSYSLKCVNCSDSDVKNSLMKYVLVAFVPLTLFYIFIIAFKISINSGNMMGYMLICQLSTSPMPLRSLLNAQANQNTAVYLLIASISVWNLDFFRSLYSPFCIHSKMNAMQVLALDYLIGVYPLILITITYIAVSLHNRYWIVVTLCKPVHKVCARIRKKWDVQGSLIQAFATFLVLSYVKILNVSFDLLFPVRVKNVTGHFWGQRYLLNDPQTVYFGREHLLYGILATVMMTIFNILPVLLLLLYPCRCFQMFLNRCGLNGRALYTFMDAIQGCYRHEPRDCRYIAGVYLIIRILFLSTYAMNNYSVFTEVIICYFMIIGSVVVFLEPYQNPIHNKIDAFFMMLTAVTFSLSVGFFESTLTAKGLSHVAVTSCVLIGMLYGVVVVILKVLPRNFVTLLYKCYRHVRTKPPRDLNEPFSDWRQEYSPLLLNLQSH